MQELARLAAVMQEIRGLGDYHYLRHEAPSSSVKSVWPKLPELAENQSNLQDALRSVRLSCMAVELGQPAQARTRPRLDELTETRALAGCRLDESEEAGMKSKVAQIQWVRVEPNWG